MSRRSWVTSSLVRRPEIFCWVFRGRTPRSLILFVGQILVSAVNRSTSPWRPLQNSSSSRPGFCFTEFFGPGTRGTLDSPASTACRNSFSSGPAISAGMRESCCSRAWWPAGMGPDGTGVGLGAVLVVAEQVLEACLVPGEVLPGLAEVVPVPVRNHHAREIWEDPGLPNTSDE